ncbi:MAG TPA: HAD family hydrolase [Gammaproteobacteria bacterium]|nr:HAD family hydrolase [Gammaproteobacteria bacterium]
MANAFAQSKTNWDADWHAKALTQVLARLQTSAHGLTQSEAAARLLSYGRNCLPRPAPPGMAQVFLRQFASPLIYVLLVAALLSLLIREYSDAGFIFAVLMINAIIGTVQEYSAQRAAASLNQLVSTRCRVLREGDSWEIDAQELVPGDIVLLESGDRTPADLRLLQAHDLQLDESLLTGESVPVQKDPNRELAGETLLADRANMVFAGSLVIRGRAQGVVVATALATEMGHIASAILNRVPPRAPLLLRMEKFTHLIALLVILAALVMAAVAASRSIPMTEIFLLVVALAVSAIPEGLPVALTVALAIGMRRMARRNVIVRRLVAVEALGSCTFIATDKTGTLTVNQLPARRIVFSRGEKYEISGEGVQPDGHILSSEGTPTLAGKSLLERLCLAAVLADNEGFIGHRDRQWSHHGDSADVALLVMAHKAGIVKEESLNAFPELAVIPFEPERRFSASLNRGDGGPQAFVKGALEALLPMCCYMAAIKKDQPMDAALLEQRAHTLASQGYRVLALASGNIETDAEKHFGPEHLRGLTLLGLVGMIDPLRNEAPAAVRACRTAGIEVAMITGDHPATALTIARELDLAQSIEQVINGTQLKQIRNEAELDHLTRTARVFARVEPQQKLDIVQSLQRNGHFVAVTGDGANDAPALRAAQVGVAMGKAGTEVARESAELILTDDNFASIIAGVEEGRIAYANVRKVIFLLISTGLAELVLFTLALLSGLPLPLLAVQLLWLNLVTNGIQDVALAFEPGEGDELHHPPRPPKEAIFNRLMIERVMLSALVIGTLAFFLFQWLLTQSYSLDEARNGTLLLMVLFENIHVFNSRSETRSVLQQNPLHNRILLFGTLAAQAIHIGAMYTPWLNNVLRIQPVSPQHWLQLLGLTLSVLIVMELHKLLRRRFFNQGTYKQPRRKRTGN